MPSTYTTNSGVEKPGSGEQSGTWGTTVNTNMDILDRSINGVLSLTLSGTTSTLTTSDGTLSDGQHKLLVLGGSLSAGHTITISPSDAEKIYFVKNDSGQTVTFTQGSGSTTVDVLNGDFDIVYADGSDECRSLISSSNLTAKFDATTFKIDGTEVTSTAAELNIVDGDTTATSTTIEDADRVVVNDDGTMVQVAMTDFETYFESALDTLTDITLNGTTKIEEVLEKVTPQTSTTGTINFDCLTQAIELYTADQTANRTINFRGDSSTTLNSMLSTNQSITVSIAMTQGSTAYYLNTYQIDGTGITPKWQGGTAPSAGNASGIDVYTFTIIKTASATYTVLASLADYA